MLTLISNVFVSVEDRIWRSTANDEESLSYFRILFGFFIMGFAWPAYSWIGTVPNSFFDPPMLSLASLLGGFPSAGFLKALDLVIIVSTVTLTLGLLTRASTILLFVSILIGNHFRYSFGKIDHEFLLLCLLFVMIFSNWGRCLSIDSLRRSIQLPKSASKTWADMRLLGVFLAFGFFTAGFGKALNWIDLNFGTNGFLRWLYSDYFSLGRDKLLANLAMSVHPLWLWEFADIMAVIFELGFVLALFSRRGWRIWLSVACVFHLLNCMILNIPFTVHSIVYLAFVPWRQLFSEKSLVFTQPKLLLLIFSVFCLVFVAIRIIAAPDGGIFLAGHPSLETQLWASCAIWIFSLGALILFEFGQELKARFGLSGPIGIAGK